MNLNRHITGDMNKIHTTFPEQLWKKLTWGPVVLSETLFNVFEQFLWLDCENSEY